MQDDFPDINPLIPTHYVHLARRCFAALANPENKGKVCKLSKARWLRCTCILTCNSAPATLKHAGAVQVTGKDL